MNELDSFTDYYKILECEKTASIDEIKRSYQRLVLTTHPDKIPRESDRFHLIQKAWTVLRDVESRRQYDAELSCREHSDLLLYDTITLSDMDYNEDQRVYSYNCRCGGTYILEKSEFKTSTVTIGCDECSFSIQDQTQLARLATDFSVAQKHSLLDQEDVEACGVVDAGDRSSTERDVAMENSVARWASVVCLLKSTIKKRIIDELPEL